MNIGQYVEKYRKARSGQEDVVLLEGMHAVKHAHRFGAELEEILLADEDLIKNLPENVLNQEDKKFLSDKSVGIEADLFDQLLPYQIRSKILALAKKPKYELSDIDSDKPIIFLENPANPENIGMVMRVVAAWKKSGLQVGALVVSGIINPFSASVLRAGAGLCFALPIFYTQDITPFTKDRKIISMDAEGEELSKTTLPKNSFIVFGTEREGISEKLKKQSNQIVSLEMRPKVSSLNLATSVSAFLYSANFE